MHHTRGLCQNCWAEGVRRRRCPACTPTASALYKRNARREAKAAGEHYWLDWWEKTYGEAALLKRREYQREYMRRYRSRTRERRAA